MPKGLMHPNQLIYLRPPTFEEIMDVIDAHGVNMYQFERFYGIFFDCIRQLRPGCTAHTNQLPTKHWHIIFENLKRIELDLPMPLYKEQQLPPPILQSVFVPKKNKKPKKKRTTKINKTGIIGELL